MRRERKGSLYLLTGLALGIALGLSYAWLVDPVEYVDASPNALRDDFKAQYRALIAAAYLANGDLARARARLDQLKDANIAQTLTIQAQQALAEGRPEAESRALGLLAVALNQGQPGSPVVILPTSTLPPTSEPSPTQSPTPLLAAATEAGTPSAPVELTPAPTRREPAYTNTPLPTLTATPTPGAPYVVAETIQVCEVVLAQPMIQVQAQDAAGQAVPGVEIIVRWDGGQDNFFTGLKAEFGLGYADYTMTPGVVYELQLVEGSEPVTDLTAVECEGENGERYWGAWLLIFTQP
ncbi:MAG: hypothetical protein JW726_15215 [Anaerolineales bacterium]|nr:hypothetical protein [Anaerolineales bacterium]